MATWTFGPDGKWYDEDGNVADETKADELTTKAIRGNKRTARQNIAGGLGRGVVGTPAMLAGISTAVPQINPDLARDAELFGGEPIPSNPSGYEAVIGAARKAGIPVDYDAGSFPGLAADFISGSLLMGGPGRIGTAKKLIKEGARPVKAYLGQFGREAGQAVAAAGSTSLVHEAAQDMENPVVKGLFGLAAPTFPQLGLLGLTGGVRAFGRGADGAGMARRAADFKAATGADAMAHQVANNDRLYLASRGLEMTGVGALPIAKQMQTQADQFSAKTATIAGGTTATPSIGGETLKQGMFGPTGWIETEKAASENLYDAYFKAFPPDFRYGMGKTKKALDEYINQYAKDPEFAKGGLDEVLVKLRADIAAAEQRTGVGPALETIRAKRSELGRRIDGLTVIPADKPQGDYKLIYKAFSEDLEDAAKAAGPAAEKAFKDADGHYKDYRAAIDTYLKPLEGLDVEALYNRVTRGTPDQVNAVYSTLSKPQEKALTEIFINRLAMKPKEKNPQFFEYSPNTFLENWKGLSPRAQSALIPNSTQRVQLNEMAKAFDTMTRNNRIIFNSSGTTGSGQLSSQIIGLLSGGTGTVIAAAAGAPTAGALAIGAGTIATTMGVSHWAAKKLADPKFVTWLAKSNSIPAVAIPGHIARLHAIDFGSDADNQMRDQAVAALMARFNGQATDAVTQ